MLAHYAEVQRRKSRAIGSKSFRGAKRIGESLLTVAYLGDCSINNLCAAPIKLLTAAEAESRPK
jgi:hypothetical protein